MPREKKRRERKLAELKKFVRQRRSRMTAAFPEFRTVRFRGYAINNLSKHFRDNLHGYGRRFPENSTAACFKQAVSPSLTSGVSMSRAVAALGLGKLSVKRWRTRRKIAVIEHS
jgi:hypothetical protein